MIEAKNRALSAVKSKSAFLANMSHEIRTPMNAIIGYTDVLQDTELDDKQKSMLKTVNHSAKSLLGLLNDVLDTAKLEQNALELEEAPFSLREVAEHVIDILQLSASKKGISLHLKYPAIIQQVFIGDAFRVRQILMNLVGNAIKFTAQGGVWLTVLSAEENVVVIIRDSGIGMSQDTLAKLFEPFSQADASTTRRFGGTGLGTTIALQLAQKMGGRIEVQSALNKGSVFQVYLPLRPAPLDALPCQDPPDTEFSSAPLPPLSILVADDDLINLDIVTVLLEKYGHRIYTASNGKEVINAWQHHDIDLILMDIQMPVMDGITACKFIRQVHPDSDKRATPIIALTAGAFQEDREAAMSAGMDGFMTKPIDIGRLQDEIERVMKRMAG
ncbi:ATP-binding protein [Chromobacterium haemolyticum]|uniref:ATP-binding protein n=1 Tax=Chromobacterium haemolyticum TaxID=394935 RepID=UPI00068E41EB|nr:ATP-binding protein [Chromobacterium haemolyticum]